MEGKGEETAGGVIRAERLELVDKGGKIHASLGLNSNEKPVLEIYNKEGKACLCFSFGLLNDREPGLVLTDEEGKATILLSLADGKPRIILRDENGEVRAVLGYAEIESTRMEAIERRPVSSLALFDKKGDPIWKAP